MHIVSQEEAFVKWLSQYHREGVFNPWGDYDPNYDINPQAPTIRCNNLCDYLKMRLGRSRYLIVAEAIGYQGGRFSGIAITCERMLLGHHKTVSAEYILGRKAERTSNPLSPFITKETQRTMGFNEPTDTVVWNALIERGLASQDVILWNIFPFHPYKVSNPLSNRTPTDEELKEGFVYTKKLLEISGITTIFAVGRKAAETMAQFDIETITLRHPANGGAKQYREQFLAALNRLK